MAIWECDRAIGPVSVLHWRPPNAVVSVLFGKTNGRSLTVLSGGHSPPAARR
jgi:hypothetical protein